MARSIAASAVRSISPEVWDRLFRAASPFLPGKLRHASAGDKIHKVARILGARRPEEMYWELISHWNPETVVSGLAATASFDRRDSPNGARSLTEWMMAVDASSYLPDDILVKVDRASMAVSLEAREPLLDHRVFEFAWQLPLSMKVRNGQGKWALRQVLYRYVPKHLIERPKMGFGVPIDVWLRGPLRDWAENLLNERRLQNDGFFNSGVVRRVWNDHLSGRRSWQYHLWDVLMFQAWLDGQRSGSLTTTQPVSVGVGC